MTTSAKNNPPHNTSFVKALFPFKENAHLVDQVAAAGYRLFAYPEHNQLVLEGTPSSIDHAMQVFKGGYRG